MRKSLLLLAATALYATQPGVAGVTAHYRVGEGPSQRRMVIEINDRGDSRTRMGDDGVMLVLGGIGYVVETDSEGTYAVRLDDALFVGDVQVEGSRRPAHGPISGPPPLPRQLQVELRRGGTEIVGGRRGTVWRIHDPSAAPGSQSDELVVSTDPALTPLNLVLGPRRAPNPAFDPRGAAGARWSIFQQGAVLREGRHLRLERAEVHPIPAAFTLPGPLLDRGAYAERRQRAGR